MKPFSNVAMAIKDLSRGIMKQKEVGILVQFFLQAFSHIYILKV